MRPFVNRARSEEENVQIDFIFRYHGSLILSVECDDFQNFSNSLNVCTLLELPLSFRGRHGTISLTRLKLNASLYHGKRLLSWDREQRKRLGTITAEGYRLGLG